VCVNTFDFMIEHLHDIPAPRPISLLLVGATLIFGHISRLNHNEVTMYISNGAGGCAIVHYAWVFFKYLKNQSKKQPNDQSN